MNKTIVKVFVIIGILVLALLVWALVFGGGLSTVYSAVVSQINKVWQGVTGDNQASLVSGEWNPEGNNIGEAYDNTFNNAGGGGE